MLFALGKVVRAAVRTAPPRSHRTCYHKGSYSLKGAREPTRDCWHTHIGTDGTIHRRFSHAATYVHMCGDRQRGLTISLDRIWSFWLFSFVRLLCKLHPLSNGRFWIRQYVCSPTWQFGRPFSRSMRFACQTESFLDWKKKKNHCCEFCWLLVSLLLRASPGLEGQNVNDHIHAWTRDRAARLFRSQVSFSHWRV